MGWFRKGIRIGEGKTRGQRGEREIIEICRGTAMMPRVGRMLVVCHIHGSKLNGCDGMDEEISTVLCSRSK
jgi:hypothetical protein